MTKLSGLILLALALPVKANEVSCLAHTIYQEARSTSAEELVMVGHTVMNEQRISKHEVCRITRQNYTSRKPSRHESTLYHFIAYGILSGKIPDLTHGADHFNEGTKPAYPGKITRQTKNFTFYILRRRKA